MALQVNYVDAYGHTNGSAYARINIVHLDLSLAQLTVQLYKDAAARSKADAGAEKEPLILLKYSVRESDFTTYFADGVLDDNNKSPLKQAYAYLKTRSTPVDFSGASDV